MGAYHFFALCRTGEEQAKNFLAAVAPARLSLPPAIDLEFANNCSGRPTDVDLMREVSSFVRLVEATTHRRMILYVSDDFDDRYNVRSRLDRRTWQLKYLRRPANDRWALWQLGGFAHVDGIDGDVDLNVIRANLEA